VGTRYSRQELEQIKALASEGLTNTEIATRLNRTEAGIRNIRHRLKLEADTRDTIQSLLQERDALKKEITDHKRTSSELSYEIKTLQQRKEDLSKAISIDEETLNNKLIPALARLKDQKPELFNITLEEQIGKIAGILTAELIKWAIS